MVGSKCILVGLLVAVFSVGYISGQESCVQCTSETDPQCATHPHYLQSTNCTNFTNETTIAGCYARIVDRHTVRGCVSALPENECLNNNLCNSCFNVNGNQGCNNQIYPEVRLFCHQCHGDLNSTCAEEQTASAELCTLYEESNQCFIRRSNETIRRGCLSSGNHCRTREHCLICDGPGCNLLVHTDQSIPLAPNSASLITMSALLGVSSVFALIFTN